MKNLYCNYTSVFGQSAHRFVYDIRSPDGAAHDAAEHADDLSKHNGAIESLTGSQQIEGADAMQRTLNMVKSRELEPKVKNAIQKRDSLENTVKQLRSQLEDPKFKVEYDKAVEEFNVANQEADDLIRQQIAVIPEGTNLHGEAGAFLTRLESRIDNATDVRDNLTERAKQIVEEELKADKFSRLNNLQSRLDFYYGSDDPAGTTLGLEKSQKTDPNYEEWQKLLDEYAETKKAIAVANKEADTLIKQKAYILGPRPT